jgi:FkbM family methyltransferase
VKVRDLRYLLGFRPDARSYGSEVVTFDLPTDGSVQYAQWLHPGETRKVIRQQDVDELRTFIAPGDVAIDIGAHSGDTTLPIALAAGGHGVVLALEPNPYLFPVLERNAALNVGKATIVPLNFAATPLPGEYEFEYSDAGFCNGGRHEGTSKWRHGHAFTLKVRGENLQDYLSQHFSDLVHRIRYVKIDAEGYDYAILQSLRELIAAQRPFLRVEVYKWTTRPQRERLYDLLAELNYEVFRLESEVAYRGPRLARQDVMAWRHYDVFCMPAGRGGR